MILTFDIETIPDLRPGAKEKFAATVKPPANMTKVETIANWEATKRPAAIEAAWRKTALNGGAGKVATIALAFEDEEPTSFYSDDWASEEGERDTLLRFFQCVEDRLDLNRGHGDSTRPLIVGHNVIAFDIRFLFQRCCVLRVPVPHWLPTQARPWDTDRVFDTMVAWVGHRDYARMDEICEALGLPTKGSEFDNPDDEIDGAGVWDAVAAGRIVDVATYCAADVERTRSMYWRMTFQF